VDASIAPPIFYPVALQFVDQQRGWFALSIAGGNLGGASFYATSDGGSSWTKVAGLQGFNGSPGPVHFATPNDGWEAWIGQEIDAYVTHDGGLSWQGTSFLPRGGLGDANAWNSGFASGVLGPNDGMVPADYGGSDPENPKTGIYVTRDAGRTWTLANPAPAYGGVMYFVSPETWVQATEENVFATQNGGADWQASDAAWPEVEGDICSRELQRIAFADADRGWAVLRTKSSVNSVPKIASTFVATEDGGRTWQVLRP
jgi:photosystem II stability/assembly factor-like uncharacterized protein